jgi:diguanylate cyclase (GGDEF)-like protein
MDGGVIVITLAAGSAAVLGAASAMVATRLSRARSERRLEPVRERIDEHVAAIGAALDRVAERIADAGARRRDELDLTLDLDALLEQVVVRAAALTGAQAVAIRVQGAAGEPVVSSFGTSDGAGLLETALGPPDERPFRALTINWTYGPAAEEAEDAYSSALVVPVVEAGVPTGALVAYAGRSSSFQSEDLSALRELADDAAPQIANARRFAELGRRSLTDPLTGVRNRSGYELELEREVARAHRTGRPLSLLLLALEDAREAGDAGGHEPRPDDPALQELVTLLRRTVRATDIPCRRRPHELAVVLPETKDDGARRLWARLTRETATGSFARSGRTLSVGLAEWRPNETSDALDGRAVAAIGKTRLAGADEAERGVATAIELGRGRRGEGADTASTQRSDLAGRFRELLARRMEEAASIGHPLVVVSIRIDDLAPVEDELGTEAADRLRAHVAARLEDCVDEGSVVSRLDADRFAVVLPRATSADARSMLAVLKASLEVRPPEPGVGTVMVSAGVADIRSDESPDAVVERAEQALAEARASGAGAVVVAETGC